MVTMNQTPEAEAFLQRVIALSNGPGVSLHDALQPSLDDEAELRKLFATDKTNARLTDPHVGLVDVFHAPADIRTTRARVLSDDQDLSRKYVMPLSEANRRKEGSPSMVNDLEEFQKNWSIFTEGSLSQLTDWNNVVAAGGSVLACLAPLSDAAKESKRSIRKYYHSVAYPTSDVDLFLWGMNEEQAEKKIIAIYEAVRDSVPWDVTCVRTKHTVSIHSQYPYRSVQIVLRLYTSPAEILAGFDIDAPCCLYNGQCVLANPRAIVAMMRQANTVDMTRRSPSYEVRLAKYSGRGFEVYVPTLERDNIDPTIYERSIARIEGLARLLVLEKLTDTDTRYNFLESRRSLRGRPNPLHRYFRRKAKLRGDLKADTTIAGLEMNDYDVATLHIPYGPGWDARRIDKLIYQTDLAPFNPKNKNRRLHRHPAFFGTMPECLEDCCEHCPEPIDADECKLQDSEDETQVRGRIAFIKEDPGRQSMSGSFNPIDVGEWSAQVYIGETQHFFAAIVAQDSEAVSKMIKNEIDVNRRDHVGRTALHVAILTGAVDIACMLVDAGARITARLVDGRSALHLAAQYDQPVVIRKLFEKSASNKASIGEIETDDKMDVDAPSTAPPERPSSEDDWTSGDDGVIAMDTEMEDEGDDEGEDHEDDEDEEEDDERSGRKGLRPKEAAEDADKQDTQDFPEDSTDEPDILEVNLPDWDLGFTPLAHAVMSGSTAAINELLKEGADVTLVNKSKAHDNAFHPLTLTILREDEDEASIIFERLVAAGASTSTADENMCTIFHQAVIADKVKLVSTILKCDPNANSVLNFPAFGWNSSIFPLVRAIELRHYSMVATLVAFGAKLIFTEEDVTRAIEATPQKKRPNFFSFGVNNTINEVFFPVETAIAKNDDIAELLIALGAEFNVPIRQSRGDNSDNTWRRTIIDWVRFGVAFMTKKIEDAKTTAEESKEAISATGWKKYHANMVKDDRASQNEMAAQRNHAFTQDRKYQDSLNYLVDIERVLVAHGAKAWNDLYPEKPSTATIGVNQTQYRHQNSPASGYVLLSKSQYGSNNFVPPSLCPAYDELYEACFVGENKKIEHLCLPQEESKETTPLNILVQTADDENAWTKTGYTPLFAAVSGRRWATAKLIMAIAIAQYKPSDKEEKFNMKGVNLYDDDGSDSGSEDSNDSDATATKEDITFVDIAKRPSAIETDIHPKRMLDEVKLTWYVKQVDGNYRQVQGNLLSKAIHDNDLDMFVTLMSLYNAAPLPIRLPESSVIDEILAKDRVDMLDEYIRRTGQGFEIPQENAEQEVAARNDKSRVYLGLTVHGKKRADLAKKNDPNATPVAQIFPLLWKAADQGAKSIVEYLSGEKPLAAYRHYATIGGDERAYQLRRITDLEKALPELLGWNISNLGDSPLMAAILGKSLDVVKVLFSNKSKFMASCLHESIKFSGYNAVLLAAESGCDNTVVDFLLAKSVSPAVNDTNRGWNLYHILAQKNLCDLLEHLLTKLPHDVNEALLAQQSKGRFNTVRFTPFMSFIVLSPFVIQPLHIAVKEGATRATKLIVQFTTAPLLMRDIDGSTPLHCAVQCGFAGITETIIKAAPPEALYMENGVGETPLDMATLKHKLEATRNFTNAHNRHLTSLNIDNVDENQRRIEPSHLDTELKRLRLTIDQLIDGGKLSQGTKLTYELNRFVETMERRLAAETALEEARAVVVEREDKNLRESCNTKGTLQAVSSAVAAAPGKRILVHLVDVQKSVQGNLDRSAKQRGDAVENDDGEGLGKEEDAESRERRGSLVLQRINTCADNY
ncbi:hypothetical protein H0H81_002731 [Sphagnurus paluster]|uniref:Ankyrin repeat protein n=1 Tax=Sphagnurus paluster TaxID=117069 RepID=A0A9P7K5M8_9AGAR|nr:hypothetical protein H0H81_002731 [Sphagnurus paluster]